MMKAMPAIGRSSPIEVGLYRQKKIPKGEFSLSYANVTPLPNEDGPRSPALQAPTGLLSFGFNSGTDLQ